MDWETHKKEQMKNPEFRKALKETELEYQVERALITARLKYGLTQKELAKKLHTKQSVISRVKTAKTTPSLSFLKRIAEVLGGSLEGILFRSVSSQLCANSNLVKKSVTEESTQPYFPFHFSSGVPAR